MLTVEMHGVTIRFDDTGLLETPYVYRRAAAGNSVYEEPFLEHIRSLGLAGTYIDVGAHLGTHSLWFALLCPATRVHAVEPVSRYADVIRRNVAANGLADKVVVHQIGVSDRAGHAVNYLSPEHQIGFAGEGSGVVESFQVRRLDELVRRERVVVIKADVEGMESLALAGATRILARHRPVVFAEAHSEEAARAVADVLAPHGYSATGRVFNATPTYEYTAPPAPRWRRAIFR